MFLVLVLMIMNINAAVVEMHHCGCFLFPEQADNCFFQHAHARVNLLSLYLPNFSYHNLKTIKGPLNLNERIADLVMTI